MAVRLPEPRHSAREAGLRYVSDAVPGIRRQRRGRAFAYLAPSGKGIRDPDELRRIKSLAIPTAWTDVWICSDPRGHLQASGRDARRRKQYRYHPRWREVRDETKLEKDLALPGLPRERVLATVVRLLEWTCIRVGNDEYARHNKSFGLTTLKDRHVEIEGSTIRFEFRGKSGKSHACGVTDRRLAKIVGRCQAIPGQDLFQYLDDAGERRPCVPRT